MRESFSDICFDVCLKSHKIRSISLAHCMCIYRPILLCSHVRSVHAKSSHMCANSSYRMFASCYFNICAREPASMQFRFLTCAKLKLSSQLFSCKSMCHFVCGLIAQISHLYACFLFPSCPFTAQSEKLFVLAFHI